MLRKKKPIYSFFEVDMRNFATTTSAAISVPRLLSENFEKSPQLGLQGFLKH